MAYKFEEDDTYRYLVEKFTAEKIASRFDFVHNILNAYIKQNELEDRVIVSLNMIEHIVVDYFVDIDRLKELPKIEKTNEVKIYSYLSFWMLRHKPLQIKNKDGEDDLVFVNEDCTAAFLISFLFKDPENVSLIEDRKPQVDEFVKTLRYHLIYRNYSAQNIELMLLAFLAGRGYQYSVDYQK